MQRLGPRRLQSRLFTSAAAAASSTVALPAISSSSSLLTSSNNLLQKRYQSSNNGDEELPPHQQSAQFPVVQIPSRNLWCEQYPVNVEELKDGIWADMILKVKNTRKYYQYPSMSAPQVGWNVRMFTLFDDEVFVNPVILKESKEECWAWEPCASCAFLMHYIKRPKEVTIKYLTSEGKEKTVKLEKMRARMALHEMDHLNGVLFTRRIPDTQHVVPLDGFNTMSDWPDDYPSLEARSTFLYSTFSPPYNFETDEVFDANMLDRKFEDGVYPGHEHDMAIRVNSAAQDQQTKDLWKLQKEMNQDHAEGNVATNMKDVPESEEDHHDDDSA